MGGILPYGESTFRHYFRDKKRHAKKKKIPFLLTEERVREISNSDCYYCGSPPSQVWNLTNYHGMFIYTGIDRVDSSKGYTEDNVVPCCWHCNAAKNTMHIDTFKQWIISVYKHFIQGETVYDPSKEA